MVCGNSSAETREAISAPKVQVIARRGSWQRRALGLWREDHELTPWKLLKYLKILVIEVLALIRQNEK